jgi:sugar lactone lactonase YvrE
LFVADSGNHIIRKIAPDGTVTTFAGAASVSGSGNGPGRVARFKSPSSIAADASGTLYVCDTENHTIRKIAPDGVVSTFAGSPGQPGTADGAGEAARFRFPQGVAVDSNGNIYVADTDNHAIRQITGNGIVTTLAGSPGVSGTNNGTGSAARFDQPFGVTVDGAGVVYVVDSRNHTIRRIIGGTVSTFAGATGVPGAADGAGSAARFTFPTGITSDGRGRLFVADTYNYSIRVVNRGGGIQTIAGLAFASGSADGSAASARFNLPNGVGVDPSGNVYVADSANHVIRKISASGTVSTLAGLAGSPGGLDLNGSAARFKYPVSLAVGPDGTIYVADTDNHAIRRVSPEGAVSTFAGLIGTPGSADGTGSSARFQTPFCLAIDTQGTLYVADTWNHIIRKVTPSGAVTTIAGRAGESGARDGERTDARFYFPEGIGVDKAGNIYVADDGNHAVRKISPDGIVTTLAGSLGQTGSADGIGQAARFNFPFGLAVDSAGNIFVGDAVNRTVRKVTPAGAVTTIGGVADAAGGTDGTGSIARFSSPAGLAIDSADQLYVADSASHTIRRGYKAAPDSPIVTASGAVRQLDVVNATKDTWSWRFVRYPADSNAQLSDPTLRNPTFVSDVNDLYTVRMEGVDSSGKLAIGFVSIEPDVEPPTLTVNAPSPDEYARQALLRLQGAASDNTRVAGVWIQLNNAEWRSAHTLNGWTNWTITFPLQAGTNQIHAYATDDAGNRSTTNVLTVVSESNFTLRLSTGQIQPNGVVDLTLEVPLGVAGQIQTSDDLQAWTHVVDFTGNGAPLGFRDPTVKDRPRLFYRAIIP